MVWLVKLNKSLVPTGPLPAKLVELGDLEKVMLSIGRSEYEVSFRYKLYVDDMKTLMGLPIDSEGCGEGVGVFLWSSHHTKVNWRGL